MRHGIVLFTSDRGITPAQAAMAAEERGFDAFYVPEHTHIPVKREAPHPRTGGKAAALRQAWADGNRPGTPDVRVLVTARPSAGDFAAWEAAGVAELLWGLPDAPREVVEGYLDRLADRVKG
jgi:hypothetical protein